MISKPLKVPRGRFPLCPHQCACQCQVHHLHEHKQTKMRLDALEQISVPVFLGSAESVVWKNPVQGRRDEEIVCPQRREWLVRHLWLSTLLRFALLDYSSTMTLDVWVHSIASSDTCLNESEAHSWFMARSGSNTTPRYTSSNLIERLSRSHR